MSAPDVPSELRQTPPVVRRRYDPARPHRAVTGKDAQVRWFERVRSVVFLVLLAVAVGIFGAAILGAVVVSANVLLELLAG